MLKVEEINSVEYAEHESTATAMDYFVLLKPRVMSLVVFTAIIGAYMAPGQVHPYLFFVNIICIAVGAGASGAFNMWYDRDIDAIMSRTRNRPIPAGRVRPDNAFALAIILAFGSVATLALTANWLSAGLLTFTIFFYVFIYTILLKRSTPQNIVIGGAAGAFPPMIGWATVSNQISLESFILFMIIFLWTPPHFWSLALYRSQDYINANVPMLPITAGIHETKTQILIYTIALVAVSLIPYFIDMSGTIYLVIACLLGSLFIIFAWQLKYNKSTFPHHATTRRVILKPTEGGCSGSSNHLLDPESPPLAGLRMTEDKKLAPRLFWFSIFYLFLLYLGMFLDKVITVI